jgi:hypothetical protein
MTTQYPLSKGIRAGRVPHWQLAGPPLAAHLHKLHAVLAADCCKPRCVAVTTSAPPLFNQVHTPPHMHVTLVAGCCKSSHVTTGFNP